MVRLEVNEVDDCETYYAIRFSWCRISVFGEESRPFHELMLYSKETNKWNVEFDDNTRKISSTDIEMYIKLANMVPTKQFQLLYGKVDEKNRKET